MNIYEFMSTLPIQADSFAIDAVTLTAMGLSGKLTMGFILDAQAEAIAVEEEKKFIFQGASGWARGSFRYASKWDNKQQLLWSILMVTGRLSNEVFNDAIAYDDSGIKFTRVDLCCDVQLSESVTSLAEKLYKSYKGKHEKTLIQSITGNTVYFGKRESAKFVRIYDKSLEYGQPLGTIWRFELEMKKALAHNFAAEIGKCKFEQNYTDDEVRCAFANMLWGTMREMDIPTPKYGVVPNIVATKVTLSSNEMKLNWLKSKVARTVKGLVAMGYKEEVGQALGIQLAMDIG